MSALKPPLGAAISLVLSVASSGWAQETATTVREAPSVTVTDTAQADWREEYAYTLGLQAYIYAFPLTYMTQLRHDWITNPNSDFYAALNQFHHKQILSNHVNFTSGGTPNQDTLYSFAWIDLRDGPVVLSHPDMVTATSLSRSPTTSPTTSPTSASAPPAARRAPSRSCRRDGKAHCPMT